MSVKRAIVLLLVVLAAMLLATGAWAGWSDGNGSVSAHHIKPVPVGGPTPCSPTVCVPGPNVSWWD